MSESVTSPDEPERWLPIPDWEDLYEVSNKGRVRSLPRIDRLGRHFKGRVLKPGRDKEGRLHVALSRDGRQVSTRISVTVALVFIGPRPADMDVCHNDGDNGNNHASNLRYDTCSGNMQDKRIHGTNHELNKTRCPQGHLYDEMNTVYTKDGFRRCRICESAKGKRKREREKALLGTEPKRHGTIGAYRKHGCRCDLCRAAITAMHRRHGENKSRRRAGLQSAETETAA